MTASCLWKMSESESLLYDDGKLKTGSFDHPPWLRDCGRSMEKLPAMPIQANCRLRHSREPLRRSRPVSGGHNGVYAEAPRKTNVALYRADNPLLEPDFESKVSLLEKIDAYARDLDPAVRQVSVSLAASTPDCRDCPRRWRNCPRMCGRWSV